MNHSPVQMVLLPGLGADARLFAPQRKAFPDLIVPDWIPPYEQEPLSEYARRYSGALKFRKPTILGGVSLGGMVAYEMARHVSPSALVLIGSCTTPRGIASYLNATKPLSNRLPSRVVSLSKKLLPLTAGLFGIHDQQQKKLFADMFNDTPPEFIRWACHAILHWIPSTCPGDSDPSHPRRQRQDHPDPFDPRGLRDQDRGPSGEPDPPSGSELSYSRYLEEIPALRSYCFDSFECGHSHFDRLSALSEVERAQH